MCLCVCNRVFPVGGRMWLCDDADGDILGDGGDSTVHDRHAPRHPLPPVWYHVVLQCESIRVTEDKMFFVLRIVILYECTAADVLLVSLHVEKEALTST